MKDVQMMLKSFLMGCYAPIECAFGRLEAKWSILTRIIDLKLEDVPIIVYACFVLHNFSEGHNSYIDDELVKKQLENIARNERIHSNTPDPVYSINEAEGEITRKTLTKMISNDI